MLTPKTLAPLSATLLLWTAVGCGDDDTPVDMGPTPTPDMGTVTPDMGTPDTGVTPDMGMADTGVMPDSGVMPDTTPPTVTITDDVMGTATGDITFTFTFSEDVGTSFEASDVTVMGGTAGTFTTVSETVSTLVVMPPADMAGTVTVSVAAMSFEDAAGNMNAAAAMATQDFNTATGPADLVVFDDNYAMGVGFVEFGGSANDLTVDTAVMQAGTASLRIAVPAEGYTGGALVPMAPMDASAYNAVSFWARADSAKTLNVTGIGNTAADASLNTEVTNLPLTPTWTQFTIPVPDASILTAHSGLFHFAEGSDEGAYNIWLDEIRYVALPLGIVTNPRPVMATATEAVGAGETFSIGAGEAVYSINGNDVTVRPLAGPFFTYTSADTAVATVDRAGVVTGVAQGMTTITGALDGTAATGMVTVNVGASCGPTGNNLATNGGFESGDFSCVQQFANGGTQSIVTTNPAAGTYAARLEVTATNADTVIKFANLAPGTFTVGQTIYVAFDYRGAVTPGGVGFAEFFSEIMGGGTSAAEILPGGTLTPNADPATWTNFRATALTGPDTSGGITLQLKAASGAGTADFYFDNVCVSTMPCP